MLRIGDAEISRVEEFVLEAPAALWSFPREMVSANAEWVIPRFIDAERDTFKLVFQTWIVRHEGKVLVVDPCNGNGRNRPLFPQFHQLDTPFLDHFSATGIRPEDVDFVFCTHLHCDHCGWNTQLRDGRWVPTFPNARYLFVRREAERWGDRRGEYKDIDYNVGVYEDSVLPIIEAGLAELVTDRHRISTALSIEPAYGHTAGHSLLRLAHSDGEVFFTGDVFHHPLQVLDPRLHLDGCDDLASAIATRQRMRKLICEREAVMLPAHFPAPHGGRIVRREGEFSFVPLGD